MPAAVTETTERLLRYLPTHLQGAHDVRAFLGAASVEIDRFEAALEEVRANMLIVHVDRSGAAPVTTQGLTYLHLWETLLGLPVRPEGKSQAQRIAFILSFVRSLATSGRGVDWAADITRLIGESWSYEEHNPADAGSPPPNSLRISIPYANALAEITDLSSTQPGAGTLAPGSYFYRVTAVNSFGETAVSNSTTQTVASGKAVSLAWGARSGATGYNVYRGVAVEGPHYFLASKATPSYVDTGAVAADTTHTPPGLNTTKSTQAADAELLIEQITPAHLDLTFRYDAGFILGVSRVGQEAL